MYVPGDCIQISEANYSLWEPPCSPFEQKAIVGLETGELALIIDVSSRIGYGQLYVLIRGMTGYVHQGCCERVS